MTLKYLADYGATVVNLESSQHPDLLRTSAPFKDNLPEIDNSGYFAYLAGNKYSVTLDLNQPKGFEIAKNSLHGRILWQTATVPASWKTGDYLMLK